MIKNTTDIFAVWPISNPNPFLQILCKR